MELTRTINAGTMVVFPIINSTDGSRVTAPTNLSSQTTKWSDASDPAALQSTIGTATHIGDGWFKLAISSSEVNDSYALFDIECDEGNQAILIRTTEPDEDDIADVVASAVWEELLADHLTDGTFGGEAITLAIVTPTGYLVVGQGRGSQIYSDLLTDGVSPRINYFVKAYTKTGETVDWTEVRGADTTDAAGSFTLYLDIGDYVLSIEKDGIQIGTQYITVT